MKFTVTPLISADPICPLPISAFGGPRPRSPPSETRKRERDRAARLTEPVLRREIDWGQCAAFPDMRISLLIWSSEESAWVTSAAATTTGTRYRLTLAASGRGRDKRCHRRSVATSRKQHSWQDVWHLRQHAWSLWPFVRMNNKCDNIWVVLLV